MLKAYAATTPEEVYEAASHLASVRFIAHGTWKWAELQMKTGGKPVYRYLYARPRPPFLGTPGGPAPRPGPGGSSGAPGARATQPKFSTRWGISIWTSAISGSPPITK